MGSDIGYYSPSFLETAAKVMNDVKSASLERLDPRPDSVILDVGCGPGIDVVSIAETVGGGIRVHGLDADAAMIELAKQRARSRGVESRTCFHCGDSTCLPFDCGVLDGIYSERLFQHLRDPLPTLIEMKRVLKPGRPVVVCDIDWGTLSVDGHHPDIFERIVNHKCNRMHLNGHSGRNLRRLLKSIGLENVTAVAHAITITDFKVASVLGAIQETGVSMLQAKTIAPEEWKIWQDDLAGMVQTDTFFACVTMVVSSGVK